ncbi:arginine ABC transporter substrate-binding protein [Erwinia pyrifoliae]|uniref:Arginine ABC transporter substrate-binding protein n=1 Tax=Erwinia pyrifoliae TaxID=79967 RepID=A0ABY5X4K7_ERWPY|nr:arginine ABC transporter substrate-binding protein [Erwinia pyrifoliae]UWS30551.1 arginine ABC transporter substrate-binding protein [Erwinia pyrifoliae]UWS32229.1 arginine ABC transporter substrate-binding protein [Erwinia pyrifoliae]
MKKIVLAALLASVAFATQAAEKIRFASSATYPPFESLNGENQIVGFDIDLANALCAQMKAECSFSNNPFDSLVPALKFRRYDAVISGMDITTERSKQVSFTQPYYANSAIVIAQKGKFSTIAQLKGKRVGVENGTTHQKYLQEKHPEMITVAYDSYQNAILDLKNGRLEGILGDSAVVGGWLKTNANLATVGEHITDSDFFGTGVGIAVRKDNQALLNQFNAAIDVLKANGTIDRLDRRWFTR